MHFTDLSAQQQYTLLTLAAQSIECGVQTGKPLLVDPSDYDSVLKNHGCCFVTLHKEGQLRGCIGSLAPHRALVSDVVEHAYAAAFQDYRFTAVEKLEVSHLQIEISVLTPQTLISCQSEQELLEQLQPFKDGLTLEDNNRRATFLPAVWQQLPDKREFVRQLKRKAGIPAHHWSSATRAYRYYTLSFTNGDGQTSDV